MRVDWAIPCRHAEVAEGGATIVGGGLETLYREEHPHRATFALAIRVAGQSDDLYGERHEVLFRLHDPSLRVVDGSGFAFRVAERTQVQPGWEAGAMFATRHQIRALESGAYGLGILIDGVSKHMVHFFVREPPSGDELSG